MDPLSLKNQALLYVVCNLEQFNDKELRVVFSSSDDVCRKLLVNLPAVDVCRLEEGEVLKGLKKSNCWDEICSLRLPRSNTWEVERNVNYDLYVDDWKSYYFCILNHVLLNRIKTDDYRSHFELVLHLFVGVQECLGIKNWSKFRFSYFAAISKDRPLIPNRHLKKLVTRRSDIDFIKQIMDSCEYRPRYFHILCDRFSESEVYKTHASDLLGRYLSHIEKFSFLYNYNEKKEAFEWHLDSTRRKKALPHDACALVIKAALFSDSTSLRSLEFRDFDAEMLEESLRFTGPLFYSTLPGKGSKNIPYRWLREFSIMLQGSQCPSSECYQKLSTIIKNQTVLEKVILQRIVTDKSHLNERYLKFLTSFSPFVKRSHFKSLSLKKMVFSMESFQNIIDAFYSSPCKENQFLRIDGSTIIGEPSKDDYPRRILMHPDSTKYKTVELFATELPRQFFSWVLGRRHLWLRRLQINNCKLQELDRSPYNSRTENIINILAGVADLRITTIEIVSVAFLHCSTSRDDFGVLFSNIHIKNLSFRGCHIGYHGVLPDITRGLARQKDLKSLESLALVDNNLSDIPSGELVDFMEAIFVLPQVNEFDLTLSHNEFKSWQLLLIHNAWDASCKPKKLKTFTAISRSSQAEEKKDVMEKVNEMADKVYCW